MLVGGFVLIGCAASQAVLNFAENENLLCIYI